MLGRLSNSAGVMALILAIMTCMLTAQSSAQDSESLDCAECGKTIPPARRKAIPGVRLCVTCQAQHDKETVNLSGYNRRGSKDSQLR